MIRNAYDDTASFITEAVHRRQGKDRKNPSCVVSEIRSIHAREKRRPAATVSYAENKAFSSERQVPGRVSALTG